MRILLVIPTLNRGGAERVVSLLSSYFAPRHALTVAYFDAGERAYSLSGEILDVGLPGGPGIFAKAAMLLRRTARMIGVLAHGRFDRVITFTEAANIPVLLASTLLRRQNRLLVSVREPAATIPRPERTLMRLLYRLPAAVVAPSLGVAHSLVRDIGLLPQRLRVIANPLAIPAAADEHVAPPDLPTKPFLLAAGRLVAVKDFAMLIQAFAGCAKTIDADLVILGDGPELPHLRKLASDLGIAERVHLHPAVAEPWLWMQACALFLLTSRHEGWPNALAEALALGRPCIATDCETGPRQLLADGACGILVPVGDVPALSAAILTVLGNSALAASLGRAAHFRMRRFTLERLAPRWLCAGLSCRRRLGGRRPAGAERIGGMAPETTRLPQPQAVTSAKPVVPPSAERVAKSAFAFLIPTRNRHDILARSLPSIRRAAQAVGATILICDQSPQPFPSAPDLIVLHRPDIRSLPVARNILLAQTTAEVVCYLDDDSEVAADFAEQALTLAEREPDCVAWGPVVESRSLHVRRLHRLTQLGVFADPRRQTPGAVDRASTALFGCCFVVRRQAAAATGFDGRRPGYALGEDFDFFLRLPGRKRFARSLRAVHRRDGTDRASAWARGQAKARYYRWLAARHGGYNPATLLHLALALATAASGAGHEPGALAGVWAGCGAKGLRTRW